MIKYQVRSRDLLDISNDIKDGRLIISPYFLRNLVWRELHKKDFIETILKGYPFPQIFIARGSIDLETMSTTSCIVDGQQRIATFILLASALIEHYGIIEQKCHRNSDTINESIVNIYPRFTA